MHDADPGGDDPGRAPGDHSDAALETPDTAALVERSSIRRNLAQMATSQVITWMLATASAVIVPRFLGPATLGRLRLAASLWAIAEVINALGTSMFLQTTLARDQRRGLSFVGPVFVVRSLSFALSAVVLTMFVAVLDQDAEFYGFMALTGVISLLVLWSDVFQASFTGLERMSTIAGVTAAMRLLGLVATVGVLLAGWGAFGVLAVGITTATIGLTAFAWRFRNLTGAVFRGWRGRLGPVVRASAPFMIVTLALTVYREIDVIVIAQIAGDRDVGWYSAADLLAGSLLFPTTVVLSVLYPTLGRLHQHDPARLRELVQETFSLLSLAAVPIGFGAALVGTDFAPLLFGDDFVGTGEALVVLGPVTILTFGTTLMAYVALATDRTRFLAALLITSALLTVPLDALLVPWSSDRFDNGAIGGAVAYVVTEVLQFVVGVGVVAPFLATRAMAWRTVRVIAAGGVMVIAVLPIRDSGMIPTIVAGVVVYAVAVLVFRVLDPAHRAMANDLLRRLRRSG